MNTKCTENSIIIALEGRIDTTNAPQVESEISAVISENPNLTPVFDADSLAYISSAGLRVLMKFCKSTGKKLSVTNVSKEIFEIFDTTGFTNILALRTSLTCRKSFVKSALKAASFWDRAETEVYTVLMMTKSSKSTSPT